MNRLEEIDENIWGLADRMKVAPGIHFPLRMTIIRSGDDLLLLSPVRIDEAAKAEIDALGKVRWIVSPNLFHWAFYNDATELWPDAERWGPSGLSEKRPEIAIDHVLGEAPESWSGIERIALDGNVFGEHVFFHAPTSSLIVTDLVFNIHETHNWFTGFVLRYVSRAFGGVKNSGLWNWVIKDKPAFAASLAEVLNLPFKRIVVAHGRIYEGTDAPEVLAEALSHHLSHTPALAHET